MKILHIKSALIFSFLFGFHQYGSAQCPNPVTMLSETFDGGNPITGAITANIYGGGSWTNASYILSGSAHGWFNVVNGLGNVDVYDRQVNGFCPGQPVEVSFWTRESYGGTNVTFTVFDDNNAVLATSTHNLNGVYQQITYNFNATTAGLRFVVHCNSTGGNGIDIVMEDLLITECPPPNVVENITYSDCGSQGNFDLFSMFSAAMPTGGTWTGPTILGNGNQGTYDPNVNTPGVYTYTQTNSACPPNPSTVTVSVPPVMNLGPDTTICDGASLTINAPAGFDNYTWSTGATTQSINVTQAGTYFVDASVQMGNTISNGDFENGNTGFSTQYTVGTGGGWGLLSNPGTYAITTSPSLVHNNFSPCGDHTSGAGNMMVVNGSSVANTNVWCQTVTVTPNTDYSFSCWITNALNDPNVANLQFFVNGVPIGSIFNTAPNGCNWQQFSDTWNSGAATSANICIVNQNTSGGGNDFAIDDITFSPFCTTSDTIVVSVESPTQLITSTDPTCVGGANGEVHVDNSLAIEYSMDAGANWQVDSFFVGLTQGTYTICSRTALGCMVCEDVTLTDPPPVLITVSNDTTICENGSVTLLANAAGGTTFTYNWGHTANTDPNQTVNPTATTTYSVFAENEHGCVSSTESIDVSLFPALNGTLTPSANICPGESIDLTATAGGGMGPQYTFTWSTGDVATTNANHTLTVSPTATTTYTVTISDGCESTPIDLSTTITVAPLPVPQYMVDDPEQCEPAVFELINTTDPALSQSVTWIVGGQIFIDQDTITTGTFMAGSYDIQMIVTSVDGCVDSLTFANALTVLPQPIASFSYSPNPVLMFSTNVQFNNSSTNAVNYAWTFESGTPGISNSENPTVLFPDGQTGDYNVTLIASSEQGCSDTTSLIVTVYPEVIIYAPNAFTPDGDEHNQDWRVFVEGVDVYDFECLIFNRWGELIWENRDPFVAWDGTYNGAIVPAGTYTWVVRMKNLFNDNKYTHSGHVTILK